jgi:hypothetical protein
MRLVAELNQARAELAEARTLLAAAQIKGAVTPLWINNGSDRDGREAADHRPEPLEPDA